MLPKMTGGLLAGSVTDPILEGENHMSKLRNLTMSALIAALMLLVFSVPVLAQDKAADSMKAAGEAMKAKSEETMKAAGDEMKGKAEETMKAAGEEVKSQTGDMKQAEGEMKQATPAGAETKEATMAEEKPVNPNAPYENVTFAKGEKPKVKMETSMGTIVIELWPDVAPKHCQSFVYLINKGFYDSLTFHRIVPGFVIQGGDPLGNGTGGPGYNVPAEFSNKPHEDGVLSMARSSDPNSAGSQFFICLGRLASLDNKYTVFGKVIEGLDVVHKIAQVPTVSERPKTPVYMTKVTMMPSATE